MSRGRIVGNTAETQESGWGRTGSARTETRRGNTPENSANMVPEPVSRQCYLPYRPSLTLTRSRSKARAKERTSLGPLVSEPTLPSPPFPPPAASPRTELAALRALAHLDADDSESCPRPLPISVLCMNGWTRFLSPNTPILDLGAAVRFGDGAELYMYILHLDETFRLVVPLANASVGGIEAKHNPSILGPVQVRVKVGGEVVRFERWVEGDGRRGGWYPTGDFTGGEASKGGRCELTGDREVSSALRVEVRTASLLV